MKQLGMVLLVLLLVTAFVMPVDALRRGGKEKELGYGFCEGNDLEQVEGLNLTAEQKTKIMELRANHLKDLKPIQDKLRSTRADLKLLWLEKNPHEGKIRAAEKNVRALRDQIDDKKNDYRWAVYRVLTAKQQELVKQNKVTGRCFGPGPGTGTGPAAGGNIY